MYGIGVCAEFGSSVFKPLVGGNILDKMFILEFTMLSIFLLLSCFALQKLCPD